MKNKIQDPSEAVRVMIKAHSDLRKQCKSYLVQCNESLNGLRKNAARDKRENAERNARFAEEKLASVEEHIHELDSFHCVIEEYMEIDKKIAELCEKRRKLCPNQLWQSSLKMTMRDGKCFAH